MQLKFIISWIVCLAKMLWQDQWLLFALIIYWSERFNITLHFLDLNIVEDVWRVIDTDQSALYTWWNNPSTVPKCWNKQSNKRHYTRSFPTIVSTKSVCKMGITSAFRSAQRVKSWCCIVILATFEGHLTQIVPKGKDIDVSLDARIQKTKYDVERKGRSQKGQELWNLPERSWQRLFGIPRRLVDLFSNSLGPQCPSCKIMWCEGRTQKGNPKQKKGIFNNNTRPHANCYTQDLLE